MFVRPGSPPKRVEQQRNDEKGPGEARGLRSIWVVSSDKTHAFIFFLKKTCAHKHGKAPIRKRN